MNRFRKKADATKATKGKKPAKVVEDKAPEPQTVSFTPPKSRRSTDIPPELMADFAHDGWALEWHSRTVTDTRTGAKIDCDSLLNGRSANRAKNGWLPCRASDFAPEGSDVGPLAEFAEDQSGPPDRIITQGGLCLMYRPMAQHKASWDYEKGLVNERLARVGGFVKGHHAAQISGSQTQSALKYNYIRTTREPLFIPGDPES